MKTVFLTHYGRPFKLGRKPSVSRCPRLSLRHYLAAINPPASCDYSPKAMQALHEVYDNDTLGDCVIACMAHAVGVFTGNGNPGTAYIFPDADIIALYSAIGGYVPGNPATDQGCNEQDALNYFQHNGAPAGLNKVAGWIAVDATNANEVKSAQWLFENLVFGISLPDAWLNDPKPGFVWDVAQPNPQNGHCVLGVGYNSVGVQVATWGMIGTITWAAIAALCVPSAGGELYTVLSDECIQQTTSKSANGIDWPTLVSDFDAMGGKIPAPSPTPSPNPSPVPTPTPTPSGLSSTDVLNQVENSFSTCMTRLGRGMWARHDQAVAKACYQQVTADLDNIFSTMANVTSEDVMDQVQESFATCLSRAGHDGIWSAHDKSVVNFCDGQVDRDLSAMFAASMSKRRWHMTASYQRIG